jgi:hypothetical protein
MDRKTIPRGALRRAEEFSPILEASSFSNSSKGDPKPIMLYGFLLFPEKINSL